MRIVNLATHCFNDFLNILFPPVCINCATILLHQEEHLCTQCRLSLPKTAYHFQKDNPLEQKLVHAPAVVAASAFLHYKKGGIAQKLIHECKYRDQPEIARMVGSLYANDLVHAKWPIDVIIPVPLHLSKQKKRGFNQSAEFAYGLSDVFALPVLDDVVVRNRMTSSQTKKSRVSRWKNMENVYKLMNEKAVRDRSVLIVDDVITTGATVGQLIDTLTVGGVKNIFVATIAAGK